MNNPAVLFDLDGTLWDSSREVAISWSQALQPLGIRITTQDVQAVMGKTLTEIAGLLFPKASPEEKHRLLKDCSVQEEAYLRAHGASPYPALRETLGLLSPKYDLAIISNCQLGYIETFLDYYDLWPYFVDTENAERTGRSKGENIKLVMERNGFQKAIYLGDTLGDQKAADFAGIPFVHAAYGFGKPDRDCPAIQCLSDLPALIATLL